jgi:hypothetical protein
VRYLMQFLIVAMAVSALACGGLGGRPAKVSITAMAGDRDVNGRSWDWAPTLFGGGDTVQGTGPDISPYPDLAITVFAEDGSVTGKYDAANNDEMCANKRQCTWDDIGVPTTGSWALLVTDVDPRPNLNGIANTIHSWFADAPDPVADRSLTRETHEWVGAIIFRDQSSDDEQVAALEGRVRAFLTEAGGSPRGPIRVAEIGACADDEPCALDDGDGSVVAVVPMS